MVIISVLVTQKFIEPKIQRTIAKNNIEIQTVYDYAGTNFHIFIN